MHVEFRAGDWSGNHARQESVIATDAVSSEFATVTAAQAEINGETERLKTRSYDRACQQLP